MSQLWQAAAPSSQEPDSELLIRLAGTADALMAKEPLEATQDDMLQIEAWLAQPAEKWLDLIQKLPQEQWLNLAVFFTAAEEQTSHWQCGANNPAIVIFRELKKQGKLPEKPVIRDIKSLTTNRYIPYGAAL